MLKKKTETTPEVVAIREVPGTSYVILPGNRLARLLKVSVYNGKEYYNPIINGDLQRIARDELMTLVEKPKAD
jgi:chromosome condensin MukBEF complex kleisin-like MukF subunit